YMLTSYFDDIVDYYIRIIYPYIVAVFISLILTVLSLLVDPKLLLILLVSVLILLLAMPLIISGISGRLYDERNRAEDTLFTELYHYRSEEHTSELQSRFDLVCRLLLEKKNTAAD